MRASGTNQYGCPPRPDRLLIALGSSTASVVSAAAFEAAAALHARLRSYPERYDQELARQWHELLGLGGACAVHGTQLHWGASGTHIHRLAARIAARGHAALLHAVMAEADETGSAVPAALAAAHVCAAAWPRPSAIDAVAIAGASAQVQVAVRLRHADGTVRCADEVDAEFAAHAQRIVRAGGRCLVVLTDLSKTGLIAPSPACARHLRARFGDRLDVLVDACQFRLAPATRCAYHEHGFMVAVTGWRASNPS